MCTTAFRVVSFFFQVHRPGIACDTGACHPKTLELLPGPWARGGPIPEHSDTLPRAHVSTIRVS